MSGIDIADQVEILCQHDVSGLCECTAILAAREIKRLRQQLAERERERDELRDALYALAIVIADKEE